MTIVSSTLQTSRGQQCDQLFAIDTFQTILEALYKSYDFCYKQREFRYVKFQLQILGAESR